MGQTTWSNDFYASRQRALVDSGTSRFDYSDTVSKKTATEQKVHEKLDPIGVVVRESRDSLNHPNSVPIGVMLDVTGSMRSVPREVQKQLPKLMACINTTGGLADPQILFGAIGDSFSDKGSLQVGQFESGVEMDEDLGRFWMEGGGGGSGEESYENAIYFFARHTVSDHWEKRAKKGYLFILGDELPYPEVDPQVIEKILDPGREWKDPIPVESIVEECQKFYHIFFIIPKGACCKSDVKLQDRWESLLGEEYVLNMDNEKYICETISAAIGLCEGNLQIDSVSDPKVKTSLLKLAGSLGKKSSDTTIRL